MINLIKADLYKEFRKKSLKILVGLVIFVSILSLYIINKNLNIENENYIIYPLYSEEAYKSVNKYGSYEQYVSKYDEYVEDINIKNEIKNKNNVNKLSLLLSYSHNFLFTLGVAIIVIAFHSFSYDFQKDTIKYVLMSKQGRKRIFFSKLISILLITFILLFLMILTLIVTSVFLTGDNIFLMKTWINNKGSLEEIIYILDFVKSSIVYFVPFFFMIVLCMFLSIVFKGSNLGLVISLIIYFSSLMVSQILFNFGFMFVKYTFFPYIDFTYLADEGLLAFNNLIYDLNFCYSNSIFFLIFYSLVFIYLSLLFLKRDV